MTGGTRDAPTTPWTLLEMDVVSSKLGRVIMVLKLTVPLVLQKEANECWYCAACMLAYFRRPGPRLGLPKEWTKNKGIGPRDFVGLALNEGLRVCDLPGRNFTASQLEDALRRCGPLWCAGQWDGLGHIVVLTGIDGDTVYINDPNPRKGRRTESRQWFNEKLDWNVPGCLMYSPAG